MLNTQAGGHAQLVFDRQFSLSRTTRLALFHKSRERRVGLRRVNRQWMLRRHRAKGHPHDGVGACGEHVHAAIPDQCTTAVFDVVGERKAHAFRLANPVFLHQLDPLRPARQPVLHLAQQLLGIVGDLEVIARDFTLLHSGTGAPALAVNHLFIGKYRHIDRVPVDNLRLAVGNAFFQHF